MKNFLLSAVGVYVLYVMTSAYFTLTAIIGEVR